ncbi:hypothetical protein BBAD15_g4946 [Beauveria bassiana D1-5]|uniref:Uncharacterized protein n=1 Tax=Beauveria bassiana D1-5 TaxID=1245745 RepID=A0A0A2VPB2_BEABA|nr:hypothetical protein BBAD15_g4946 [Beauveria bassiana D1-5]
MARFIDLEIDDNGGDTQDPSSSVCFAAPPPNADVESVATPTVCNAVTRAFQCYPIVVGVVSHIDLTTLDSLARASRMIHHGLVQYRVALLAATLRCSNENLPLDTAARANAGIDSYTDTSRQAAGAAKASRCCARDMVGECRRCAAVICRASHLTLHLPLMRPQRRAPSASVIAVSAPPAPRRPSSRLRARASTRRVRGAPTPCSARFATAPRAASGCASPVVAPYAMPTMTIFASGAGATTTARSSVVWAPASATQTAACLAARECEQEIDCDAEDARSSRAPSTSSSSDHHQNNPATPPGAHNHDSFFPASWSSESRANDRIPSSPLLLGPGYERHEIEGIGGIVKRKLVRMVRVGKCVPEWEEERTSARVLGREARGEARSWCGWCWRVVPGRDDPRPADKLSAVPSRPLAQTAAEAAAQQSRPPPTPAVCPPAGS